MLLNPDVDTVLEPGDSVVVISEDDDTYQASSTCLFNKEHVNICDVGTATVIDNNKTVLDTVTDNDVENENENEDDPDTYPDYVHDSEENKQSNPTSTSSSASTTPSVSSVIPITGRSRRVDSTSTDTNEQSGFYCGRAKGKGRRGSCSYNTLKAQLCDSIASPYQPREKFKEKLLFIG